jgi:hypothetical protein
MPRGLGSVQLSIVMQAYTNQGSVLFSEVLCGYFGLPKRGKRFAARELGKSYRYAWSSLNRATRSLDARGLIVRHQHGVRLTESGIYTATHLMQPGPSATTINSLLRIAIGQGWG